MKTSTDMSAMKEFQTCIPISDYPSTEPDPMIRAGWLAANDARICPTGHYEAVLAAHSIDPATVHIDPMTFAIPYTDIQRLTSNETNYSAYICVIRDRGDHIVAVGKTLRFVLDVNCYSVALFRAIETCMTPVRISFHSARRGTDQIAVFVVEDAMANTLVFDFSDEPKDL